MHVTENNEFLTRNKFTKLIEDTVQTNRCSYMEAVIELCEMHNLEIEEVKKFISPIVKDKIEAEARKLNFLPRQNELPIE